MNGILQNKWRDIYSVTSNLFFLTLDQNSRSRRVQVLVSIGTFYTLYILKHKMVLEIGRQIDVWHFQLANIQLNTNKIYTNTSLAVEDLNSQRNLYRLYSS